MHFELKYPRLKWKLGEKRFYMPVCIEFTTDACSLLIYYPFKSINFSLGSNNTGIEGIFDPRNVFLDRKRWIAVSASSWKTTCLLGTSRTWRACLAAAWPATISKVQLGRSSTISSMISRVNLLLSLLSLKEE